MKTLQESAKYNLLQANKIICKAVREKAITNEQLKEYYMFIGAYNGIANVILQCSIAEYSNLVKPNRQLIEQLIEALSNIELDLENEVSDMERNWENLTCETIMDYNYKIDCKKIALSELKNAIVEISGLEIGKEYCFLENGKKKKCKVDSINIYGADLTVWFTLIKKNGNCLNYLSMKVVDFKGMIVSD